MRVVALVLLAAAVRPPHAAFDDDACSWAGLLRPSGAETALTRGQPDAPAQDHCAVCHWTRLLRSPLTAVSVAVVSNGAPSLLGAAAAQHYTPPADRHLPARAPPAVLL